MRKKKKKNLWQRWSNAGSGCSARRLPRFPPDGNGGQGGPQSQMRILGDHDDSSSQLVESHDVSAPGSLRGDGDSVGACPSAKNLNFANLTRRDPPRRCKAIGPRLHRGSRSLVQAPGGSRLPIWPPISGAARCLLVRVSAAVRLAATSFAAWQTHIYHPPATRSAAWVSRHGQEHAAERRAERAHNDMARCNGS